MSSSGNTIGILVPQPSAPAMVSQGSANPPEPLTNAAGPVDVIEMVADVASSALSLVAPDSAAANVADAVSDVVSLASMVPGLPSVRLPSRKMVSGFGGGSGAGSDGGVVTSGHGHCIPCKVAAAIGNPVNAVLGIKVLFDETETDFAFDSPLPLVWQRSYYSDQIGNGWLGQGWSLPFSMRLVRTADGFLYIDEQGREISLPDISDEADEPYSAADEDEDDLYEEEAAPRPASAEEDPYGLDNAYFDPYEQIFFSQIQTTSTKSPPPTAAHGYCLPKSIPAAAFSNWSHNSTATAAISASATTTTGCRTAFTTAAADTSNLYSPPSVCTTTIPISTRPGNGTYLFPKTNVSTLTALPPSPSTARNWCATTTTAAAI